MKVKERLKSVLLGLLILSSVVLALQLWVLEEVDATGGTRGVMQGMLAYFFPGTGGPASLYGNDREALDRALLPVSFYSREGDRQIRTAMDEELAKESYGLVKRRLSAIVQDSATQVDRLPGSRAWREMLTGDGFVFDYGAELPISMFYQLLGGTVPAGEEGIRFRFLCVALEQDQAVVGFLDEKTGDVLVLENSNTEELFITLRRVMEAGGEKEEIRFLFELGDLKEKLGGATVRDEVALPLTKNALVTASAPAFDDEFIRRILSTFGYSPSSINKYQTTDGGQIYVENYSTLRISNAGGIEYHVSRTDKGLPTFSGGSGGAVLITRLDMVAAGFSLLNEIGLPQEGSRGQIILRSIRYKEELKGYELSFGYFVDGKEVLFQEGDPIVMEFTDGYITKVEINIKNFSQNGNGQGLPERLFLDLLRYSGEEELGLVEEVYRYTEDGQAMAPVWMRRIQGGRE